MTKPFFKCFNASVCVFIHFFATENVAFAQSPAPQTNPVQSLEPIQISGRSDDSQLSPLAGVALSQTPHSAVVLEGARLKTASRASELTALDASLSDAYNATGYWDGFTIRGLALDNRTGFRREGMPISAETSIALFNKERLEVFKGATGFAAGVAVPAGLVNYRIKRPVAGLRTAEVRLDDNGAASLGVDVSDRIGAFGEYGLRLNAQVEKLQGAQPQTRGDGRHFALAGQWQINRDTVLDLETELSRRAQPSAPGQSLWGNALPAVQQRGNPAAQAWGLPVVFAGQTHSLRLKTSLNAAWQLQLQANVQNLQTQDRTVFPFGCSDASGAYFADRFCPNGDADLYDYRSENERRKVASAQASLTGAFTAAGFAQRLGLTLLRSKATERYQAQAYNYLATASSVNPGVLPQDPALTGPNTNRDEASRELALNHAVAVSAAQTLWWGVRSNAIARASVRTDSSRPSDYSQLITTPWLALTHRVNAHTMLYASRSSGAESDVVPNRARYTNAGAALPALVSWQSELGLKVSNPSSQITAALYTLNRPVVSDIGTCTGTADCTRVADGSAVHQGFELSAQHRFVSQQLPGSWRIGASLAQISATRQGSALPGINGFAPTNVPRTSLRANASYTPAALSQLNLEVNLQHEGRRQVLPDNSVQLPGWAKLDLSARYVFSSSVALSAGLENLTNARAWRESPYQFGHSYLFALTPRRLKLGLSFNG